MKFPDPRKTISCLLFLVLIISNAAAGASSTQQKSSRITALKVSTLDSFEAKLSLSDDLFADQKGNAPVRAGTGAANYPEHHLLVLVEVTGNTGAKVELRATEGRKLVWRKVTDPFYEKGGYDREDLMNPRTYAIFFIEGTRCETLKLTARLIGQRKPSSMSRTIEFSCGE